MPTMNAPIGSSRRRAAMVLNPFVISKLTIETEHWRFFSPFDTNTANQQMAFVKYPSCARELLTLRRQNR